MLKGSPNIQEGDLIEFWNLQESTPQVKNVIQNNRDQETPLLRAYINLVYNIKNIGKFAG
jgi:hypothetical protein